MKEMTVRLTFTNELLGSTVTFTVVCMVDSDMDTVREWLDYGAYHGTGQWRNGSKGTFVWEEVK